MSNILLLYVRYCRLSSENVETVEYINLLYFIDKICIGHGVLPSAKLMAQILFHHFDIRTWQPSTMLHIVKMFQLKCLRIISKVPVA